MNRAFHSATWLFSPDVIFFLGDLLDEGHWSNEEMFNSYAKEFKTLFDTDIPMYAVAGNHDLGFHYE